MHSPEEIVRAYNTHELERSIFAAQREIHAAQDKLAKAKQTYREAVAKMMGCEVAQLNFDTSIVCMNKLIAHHVFDIRKRDQHPCIFCGCPEND